MIRDGRGRGGYQEPVVASETSESGGGLSSEISSVNDLSYVDIPELRDAVALIKYGLLFYTSVACVVIFLMHSLCNMTM